MKEIIAILLFLILLAVLGLDETIKEINLTENEKTQLVERQAILDEIELKNKVEIEKKYNYLRLKEWSKINTIEELVNKAYAHNFHNYLFYFALLMILITIFIKTTNRVKEGY